jgi:hypothetical protein
MELFIGTVRDPGHADRLEIAISGEERSGGSSTSWHAGPESLSTGIRSPRSASVAGHGPGSPASATTYARGPLLHDPASRMGLHDGMSAPARRLSREILSPGSSWKIVKAQKAGE